MDGLLGVKVSESILGKFASSVGWPNQQHRNASKGIICQATHAEGSVCTVPSDQQVALNVVEASTPANSDPGCLLAEGTCVLAEARHFGPGWEGED